MQLDFSPVAVTFQCVGTLLLALMMARLGRIFAWRYAAWWACAWGSMFLALAAVRIYISGQPRGWWFVYLVGEWAFLFLLWAGCRELIGRSSAVRIRQLAYVAPMALAVAAVIVKLSTTFNDVFTAQAGIISMGMMVSYLTLGMSSRRTAGWHTMRLSIALVAILYAAYVPLYAFHARGLTLSFLTYSSLADLLGSVFLGFGMILVTAEDAVNELSTAQKKLEEKVRTDPLTEALNRHAFQITAAASMSGAVFMIDIDHLKWINDAEGHPTGDEVIRAAANAVRGRIRADDLLFRWGGDEFLVVVPNSTIGIVAERLAPLASGVTAEVPGTKDRVRFTMSWGGAEFGTERSLEEAIRIADAEMYDRREAARLEVSSS
jgi:diguanylate cyclase (GGDEF)-like protein